MVFKKGIHPKTEFKIGNKICVGRKFSDETKLKMRLIKLGKPLSLEHRIKLGKIRKGHPCYYMGNAFKKGEQNITKNPLIRRKISETNKGKHLSKNTEFKPSDKHIMWLGGKSFEPYNEEWKETLKESIRQRDNFKCQLCNMEQNGHKLAIHHIDYDKKNCNPANLITLCKICHNKTNMNRNWWHFYLINKENDKT